MKVKFVNGVAGNRGAMVVSFEGRFICGRYTRHYYRSTKKIVVVKQRSIWFTILILIHEFAHYLCRELFKGDRKKRVNDWIDKHMIRPRDKK